MQADPVEEVHVFSLKPGMREINAAERLVGGFFRQVDADRAADAFPLMAAEAAVVLHQIFAARHDLRARERCQNSRGISRRTPGYRAAPASGGPNAPPAPSHISFSIPLSALHLCGVCAGADERRRDALAAMADDAAKFFRRMIFQKIAGMGLIGIFGEVFSIVGVAIESMP